MIKDFEAYSKEYVTPEVKVFVVVNRRPVCDSLIRVPSDDVENMEEGNTNGWF